MTQQNRRIILAALAFVAAFVILQTHNWTWAAIPEIDRIAIAILGLIAVALPLQSIYADYSKFRDAHREARLDTAPHMAAVQFFIMLAVVASNIQWQWTPKGSYASLVFALAVAVVVSAAYRFCYRLLRAHKSSTAFDGSIDPCPPEAPRQLPRV